MAPVLADGSLETLSSQGAICHSKSLPQNSIMSDTPLIVENIKPTLLITGAGGMLGHALCSRALAQWSVLALYRHNKPQVPGIRPIQMDLTDHREVARLVKEMTPSAIIHAAAAAQVGVCQANPRQTALINVDVTTWLADLCAESNIDYLFTSTDLVFDGEQAPYDEQGQVNPICTYGEQKAQAEQAVLLRYPKALVCRLPLMFGLAPYAGRHFSMHLLKCFRQKQRVNLLTDEYRTPVDSDSAALGILQFLGRAHGLLHMGGRTRISRYDMGRLMVTRMGADSELICPVTIRALDLGVARAPDCALVSDKAYQLGYAPSPFETAIGAMVDEFKVITSI